jgi:hypothetical protein
MELDMEKFKKDIASTLQLADQVGSRAVGHCLHFIDLSQSHC